MCTARLFHGAVDLFALKFYLDRVFPINHSWLQKTEDTGLFDGEDRIPLRSLVLTQYRSVTDGRTYRIYRSIYIAVERKVLRRLHNLSIINRFTLIKPITKSDSNVYPFVYGSS